MKWVCRECHDHCIVDTGEAKRPPETCVYSGFEVKWEKITEPPKFVPLSELGQYQ